MPSDIINDSAVTCSLQVVATDRGSPPRSSTATVAVTVVDDNDNTPQCSPRMYSVSLREDVATNTAVATLACSDTYVAPPIGLK